MSFFCDSDLRSFHLYRVIVAQSQIVGKTDSDSNEPPQHRSYGVEKLCKLNLDNLYGVLMNQ